MKIASSLLAWSLGPVALLALSSALSPTGFAQADPVIVAAGDIACDPADKQFNDGAGSANLCRMKATSDLAVAANPTAVLALGDTQYEDGALSKFQKSYDPTWGRLKSITHPAVGNHEYLRPKASGYFAYFGSAAGDAAKGYYSYDLGAWHLVALNSNCSEVSGCGAGSPQERWLKADLGAHPGVCTLAYWHHPRFSSGLHGNDSAYGAFWQDLYQARAAVVLVGHDHDYERFAPQDPHGVADPIRGVREFVVGTGGRSRYWFRSTQPNSEVRRNDLYGVLRLTLHPTGYEWQFLSEPDHPFEEAGTGACH